MQHYQRKGNARWQPCRRYLNRNPLPAQAHATEILRHIRANSVTFIQGDRGCGKSSCVPEMILDDAGTYRHQTCVFVVQPCEEVKTLAEHVAHERRTCVGEDVGYAVSDSHCNLGQRTRLIYTTPNCLFLWLIYSNAMTRRMTHLVLDDVHIQTIEQDILFLLIKLMYGGAITRIKIIIMSTHLENCPIMKYFSSLSSGVCYPIYIERIPMGKGVQVIYADDLLQAMPDLSSMGIEMVNKLKSLRARGSNIPHFLFDLVGEIILCNACVGDVFLILLPGIAEMTKLEQTLQYKLRSGTTSPTFKLNMLYSYDSQRKRKRIAKFAGYHVNIVLTNAAESKISIPRVKYIIDFGLEECNYFDPEKGLDIVKVSWCSKQKLKLRAAMVSYDLGATFVFRLFSRKFFENLKVSSSSNKQCSAPDQALLRLKAHMSSYGQPCNLIQQMLNPPNQDITQQSIEYLKHTGAIQLKSKDDFNLTHIGRLAVKLSVEVGISRLIMLGMLLSCSVECIIISAALLVPDDIFKKPFFQSGHKGNCMLQKFKLNHFSAWKEYDNGRNSDLLVFCSIYRNWLSNTRLDNLDPGVLSSFLAMIKLLASNVASFMLEEKIEGSMNNEYMKITELAKRQSNHPSQQPWFFCEHEGIVLVAISGAFFHNVIIGSVPNDTLAEAEFVEISNVGFEACNTVKLSHLPAETLDNSQKLQDILTVLGPISRIETQKSNETAYVECARPMDGKKEFRDPNIPEVAQKLYFLANQGRKKVHLTVCEGSGSGSVIKEVCLGKPTMNRQIFWSTYVKGKKYGISLCTQTSLPQCIFSRDNSQSLLLAVATCFVGIKNSQVIISKCTLLPSGNFFSVIMLLLFRPSETYLIRADATNKFVYSLQYGPLQFNWKPKWILLDDLHLVEKIRTNLKMALQGKNRNEKLFQNDILELLLKVSSHDCLKPKLDDSSLGPWIEFPSLNRVNSGKYPLAWKLNMKYDSFDSIEKGSEESRLLSSFQMVDPGLEIQSFENWLDGNKSLNVFFYSLLEKLITDPELEQQADHALRFMHKKCDELVPKKMKAELEGWYHTHCNPLPRSGTQHVSTTGHKIILQKQESIISFNSRKDYLPIICRTIRIGKNQIPTIRREMKNRNIQAKILLPRDESQSDNVVVWGPSASVNAALKWIESVTPDRMAYKTGVNITYFLAESELDRVHCIQDTQSENNYSTWTQFSIEQCIESENPSTGTMTINLGEALNKIKACLSHTDESAEIEVQARLGHITFSCPNRMRELLPFETIQTVEQIKSAFSRKMFVKQRFDDTVQKDEYLYIRACLRLYKPQPTYSNRTITIFLQEPGDNTLIKKLTMKECFEEPKQFQLLNVQQKTRLAVIDIVQLVQGYIKADIRLSVQALKEEVIEDHYRDFVSRCEWDGAIVKSARGPYGIKSQRVKNTEIYTFGDFSVSLNEITQVRGRDSREKFEVEISPARFGKYLISVQDAITNFDEIFLNLLSQARSITTDLCLKQASSSTASLACKILCSSRHRSGELSIHTILLQNMNPYLHPINGFNSDQKHKMKVSPDQEISGQIDILIDILWKLDGEEGGHLSINLISTLLRSLHFIGFKACITSVIKAQEMVSRDCFPACLALPYASMFKCLCWRNKNWIEALKPHLAELRISNENVTMSGFNMDPNIAAIQNLLSNSLLDVPTPKLLSALRRRWIEGNSSEFLKLYKLVFTMGKYSSETKALIQLTLRQLFHRYHSKAPTVVLNVATCYITNQVQLGLIDNQFTASVVDLIDNIQNFKLTITEDCRLLALNILLNLEIRNDVIKDIERKIFDTYTVDEAIFRHYQYHKILSTSLTLKDCHLKELERRGLSFNACKTMEFKSWKSGKNVVSSCLIPGLNEDGSKLIGSPGIFIPARDPFGHIVGAQIKVDQTSRGKYKWLSSNRLFEGGKGPSLNNELPLFCCIPSSENISILGLCEGGLKAHVLSFLSGYPVIGASGAAFQNSRNLFEKYLAIIDPNQVIFFPDAGSQCNDQIARCYFQTFRLVREFGYTLLIAWWGQVNKVEHEDIDDLLCNGKVEQHSLPLILPEMFWHLLVPSVRRKIEKEFPDFSGVSEYQSQEELTDEDEIKISRSLQLKDTNIENAYDMFLLSIPKHIIKFMPPPPDDMVTPSSVPEFIIEIRTVMLYNDDHVNECLEWLAEDSNKASTCAGFLCQYDSDCNPCLLQLSFHQRCLLIQIPPYTMSPIKPKNLETFLLNKNIIKAGLEIHRDVLHVHRFLHLKTNSCKKINQHHRSSKRDTVLSCFRSTFKWDWCEKTEVMCSDWRSFHLTLEQIKYATLSAWSAHLICAFNCSNLDSFCLDELPQQLLEYFERVIFSVDASKELKSESFELAGANVELHKGLLVLQHSNIPRKTIRPNSMVQITFNDGQEPEEYMTKRSTDKFFLKRKMQSTTCSDGGTGGVDISTISKVIVDNSQSVDMQKQKLEDAIFAVLCSPRSCPEHINRALGCSDTRLTCPNGKFQLPEGIPLNKSQVDAWRTMLTSPLCAVIGPPGTGKTTLITGTAKSWDYSSRMGEVLLCTAQQNVAVRHMAETMVKNKIAGVMLLVSRDSFSEWPTDNYEHLQEHIVLSGPGSEGQVKAWTARNRLRHPRVLICTLALIGSMSFDICLRNGKITYMIIDECSQTAEGELISNLMFLPHLEKLSVLGDPCQLAPFGRSVQSVFDLVSGNCNTVTLNTQYRMPQAIAEFISEEFYEGKLHSESNSNKLMKDENVKPLLWVNICGSTEKALGSTSLCNRVEADAVARFCRGHILQKGNCPSRSSSPSASATSGISSISNVSSSLSQLPSKPYNCGHQNLVVLTLYEGQRLLITQLLKDYDVEGINVHNVDAFQGQEADEIVISLVVGRKMSPFASDRRRACVLLSRAKRRIYLFGNFKEVRSIDENGSRGSNIWRSLAVKCEKSNCVQKADQLSEITACDDASQITTTSIC